MNLVIIQIPDIRNTMRFYAKKSSTNYFHLFCLYRFFFIVYDHTQKEIPHVGESNNFDLHSVE